MAQTNFLTQDACIELTPVEVQGYLTFEDNNEVNLRGNSGRLAEILMTRFIDMYQVRGIRYRALATAQTARGITYSRFICSHLAYLRLQIPSNVLNGGRVPGSSLTFQILKSERCECDFEFFRDHLNAQRRGEEVIIQREDDEDFENELEEQFGQIALGDDGGEN